MIRALAIIAISGFLFSAICIGAAGALGGLNGWNPRAWEEWAERQEGFNIDADEQGNPTGFDGPPAQREIVWTGASEVVIEIPAIVHFTQAPQAKLVIRGPQGAIEKIRVDGGRLYFSPSPSRCCVEGLEVEMSAPSVTRFVQKSRKTITLDAIDQDRVELVSSGSGNFVARGRARRLEVKIDGSGDVALDGFNAEDFNVEGDGSGDTSGSGTGTRLDLRLSGSGDADLASLAVQEARVSIEGSGDASVAPTRSVYVEIDGSGDVVLHSRPAEIRTNVDGSGDVRYTDVPPPVSSDAPSSEGGNVGT